MRVEDSSSVFAVVIFNQLEVDMRDGVADGDVVFGEVEQGFSLTGEGLEEFLHGLG